MLGSLSKIIFDFVNIRYLWKTLLYKIIECNRARIILLEKLDASILISMIIFQYNYPRILSKKETDSFKIIFKSIFFSQIKLKCLILVFNVSRYNPLSLGTKNLSEERSSLFFSKIRKEGIDIGLAFDDNVIILSRTLSRENKDSYEGGG